MNDEIIQEIWQIKDAIGKEVNYNINSLGALLRKRQRTGNKQIIDLSSHRKLIKMNKLPQIAEQKHTLDRE